MVIMGLSSHLSSPFLPGGITSFGFPLTCENLLATETVLLSLQGSQLLIVSFICSLVDMTKGLFYITNLSKTYL